MKPFGFFLSIIAAALLVVPIEARQLASASPTPEAIVVKPASNNEPRSRRERAFIKLFEGQKQLWKRQRLQTEAGRNNARLLAKAAFQSAVEIDPELAEAYTALADIAVMRPAVDIEEGITLAKQAVRLDPDSFGGRRILARLYTVKSRLGTAKPDAVYVELAVNEWRQVTRLDPRNAEGWAFISAFSESAGRTTEQVDALRKWVSAVPPLDVEFYSAIMGGQAQLTSDHASTKLAAVLAKSGKRDEATTILSNLIADDAQNSEAISMLSEIIDSAEGEAAAAGIGALQQAVFANPENISLLDMLARLQSRTGKFDDAVRLLNRKISHLEKSDVRGSSTLLVSLAVIYLDKDRYDEAAKAFDSSIDLRVSNSAADGLSLEDREFATYVFEKLIHTHRLAEKTAAAKTAIEKARRLFGKDDSFADRQLIYLLHGTGDREAALTLVRGLRINRPSESGLVRTEATILAELGKLDAAVELVKKQRSTPRPVAGGSSQSGTIAVPVPSGDEFSDLLFISNLYSQANRPKEAIEAANQAFTIAAGNERKQIAKMSLATAQQMSGDFAAAELTLRDVLKQTPGNPIALNNLGYFLAERGERLEEAIEMIRQALSVDAKNASYLDSLGWAYFKQGKLVEAEKYLKEAARVDLDSAAIQEHLGDLFREKKDLTGARTFWSRALRLASDSLDIARLKKKMGK